MHSNSRFPKILSTFKNNWTFIHSSFNFTANSIYCISIIAVKVMRLPAKCCHWILRGSTKITWRLQLKRVYQGLTHRFCEILECWRVMGHFWVEKKNSYHLIFDVIYHAWSDMILSWYFLLILFLILLHHLLFIQLLEIAIL